jgi:hypothetical protein
MVGCLIVPLVTPVPVGVGVRVRVRVRLGIKVGVGVRIRVRISPQTCWMMKKESLDLKVNH